MADVIERAEFDAFRECITRRLIELQERIERIGGSAPAATPQAIGRHVSLRWVQPAAQSVVRHVVGLELAGENLARVEIFRAGTSIGIATIIGTAVARFDLDTTKLPNGTLHLTAHAWNAQTSEAATADADAGPLSIEVANDPAQLPPPAPRPRLATPPAVAPHEITSPLGKRRVLAFDDDFNGVKNGDAFALDESKWNVADPDRIEMRSDSILRIHASELLPAVIKNGWAIPLLSTDGKFNFQYGYVEIRGRVRPVRPDDVSVRLLPNRNGGIGVDRENEQHRLDHATPPVLRWLSASDLDGSFRVYGVEWDDHDIVLATDGTIVKRLQTTPPFRVSMYLAIDCMMYHPGPDRTLDIDYVRVWR